MIRERILRIHIDDNALNFSSDEQIREFQHALGRMVSYGMRSNVNSGVEHLELSIAADREIVGAYYPPILWPPGAFPPELRTLCAELGAAIDLLKKEQPFVIGAVLRPDGNYSYSS